MPDEGSYTLFSDPRAIEDKAANLVSLIRRGPGRPLVRAGDDGRWAGMLGPALLSKAAGTLESMMLLLPSGRSVDAMTLLRTLFENAVVFAWIAADPDGRFDAWYRSSAFRELKDYEDWRKAGVSLWTSEYAKDLKSEVGHQSQRLPKMSVMAQQADEAWGGRVPGWSASSSAADPGLFSSARGLYRYIYQRGGGAVHSSARGLDPFVLEREGAICVSPERCDGDLRIYALGLYALAFAIMASDQSLGWPSWRQAARILERESALFGDSPPD